MRGLDLTVHVSTKLNRSHAVTGREALILPCLGRTERDTQVTGDQVVTVEDSMGMVHASRGRLQPRRRTCSPRSRSSPGWPRRCWPDGASGHRLGRDARGLRAIRDRIERVIPGFDDFNERIEEPGGFALPHPPRDRREFKTETGKARFTVQRPRDRSRSRRVTCCSRPSAATTSSTPRSTASTTATAGSRRAAASCS